jgi:hypothetical protein
MNYFGENWDLYILSPSFSHRHTISSLILYLKIAEDNIDFLFPTFLNQNNLHAVKCTGLNCIIGSDLKMHTSV